VTIFSSVHEPDLEQTAPVSFWGIEVKPGSIPSSFCPPQGCVLHVTQATLGHRPPPPEAVVSELDRKEPERIFVTCLSDACRAVICTLKEGSIENVPLGLQFSSSVELTVSSSFSVFLSGFLEAIPSAPDDTASLHDIGYGEEEEEEDDEYDSPDEITTAYINGFPYGEVYSAKMDEDDDQDDEANEDDDVPADGVIFNTPGVFERTDEKKSAAQQSSASKAPSNAPASTAQDLKEPSAKKRKQTAEEPQTKPPKQSAEPAPKKLKENQLQAQKGTPTESASKHKKNKKTKQKEQLEQKKQQTDEAKSSSELPKQQKAKQKGAEKKNKNQPEDASAKPDSKANKAQKPKIVKLQEGLQYQDLKVGSGAEARKGCQVSVRYRGVLTQSGKEFDSNMPRGKPFRFTLGAGEVIRGWDLGLAGMQVGGKRRLVIPAHLGYGSRGAPPQIPPNSSLTFDVELLSA